MKIPINSELKPDKATAHISQNIKSVARKSLMVSSNAIDSAKRQPITATDKPEGEIHSVGYKWYYMYLRHGDIIRYKNNVLKNFTTYIYTTTDHKHRYEDCHYTVEEYRQHRAAAQHAIDILDGKIKDAGTKDINHTAMAGSGFLFIYGEVTQINQALKQEYPAERLAIDRNTRKETVIPDDQMRQFIYLYEAMPWKLEIMNCNLEEYVKTRQRIRITAGVMAGKEGYLMRIHRELRLCFALSNMTVSITDMHAFPFERVGEKISGSAIKS